MVNCGCDEATLLRMLDAMRDPVRLKIVFLLGRSRMPVSDIAAQFQQSRPGISHHLRVLKDAAILQSEKAGQEIFYWVDRPHVVSVLRAVPDALEKCC